MATKSSIVLKTILGGKECVYEGRFLGFLKDDEFNALIQTGKELATKLESKPTQSIIEVARSNAKLPGTRLVMVVRKCGDESVVTKRLFVSPRCDYASSLGDGEVVIELMDNSNSMVIEEEKDEK